MKTIFEIKNLECKYKNTKNSVLFIDELEIYKGEIVFIAGASGIGKSTILETLGLMNNTLVDNSRTRFLFTPGKERIDYTLVWGKNNKNDNGLSQLRSKYFSFIFQDSTLFTHLSAYENVALPLLLSNDQDGNFDVNDANKITSTIFNEILEDYSTVDNDKLINLMSGGQRQRVAFTRAVASDFNVLFGDEPTGNLDPNSATKCMDLLRSKINSENAAVIVSHDVSLALKYADRIIVINKEGEKPNFFGKIDKNSVFIRKNIFPSESFLINKIS